MSNKKSINLKKKNLQKGKIASDKSFYKFRKEYYYETLKAYEVAKKDDLKKDRENS